MSNLTMSDLLGLIKKQEKEIYVLQGQVAGLLALFAATTIDPKPSLEKVKETANKLVPHNSEANTASNNLIKSLEETRKFLAA